MRENYFLRWVGFVVFVLVIWLFFPFLKSFFVALLMAMATFSIYHPLETKLKQSKKLKVNKSISNRFEVTKNGVVLREASFDRHLRRKKSKKQLRRLKGKQSVTGKLAIKIRQILGK